MQSPAKQQPIFLVFVLLLVLIFLCLSSIQFFLRQFIPGWLLAAAYPLETF